LVLPLPLFARFKWKSEEEGEVDRDKDSTYMALCRKIEKILKN